VNEPLPGDTDVIDGTPGTTTDGVPLTGLDLGPFPLEFVAYALHRYFWPFVSPATVIWPASTSATVALWVPQVTVTLVTVGPDVGSATETFKNSSSFPGPTDTMVGRGGNCLAVFETGTR
jgi:hypothetical protein